MRGGTVWRDSLVWSGALGFWVLSFSLYAEYIAAVLLLDGTAVA